MVIVRNPARRLEILEVEGEERRKEEKGRRGSRSQSYILIEFKSSKTKEEKGKERKGEKNQIK